MSPTKSSKPRRKRRSFTPEFKAEAVRLVRVRVREVGEHIAPPPPDGTDPGDDEPSTDAGGCCQGSAGAAGAWPIVLAVRGAIRGRRRSRLST